MTCTCAEQYVPKRCVKLKRHVRPKSTKRHAHGKGFKIEFSAQARRPTSLTRYGDSLVVRMGFLTLSELSRMLYKEPIGNDEKKAKFHTIAYEPKIDVTEIWNSDCKMPPEQKKCTEVISIG